MTARRRFCVNGHDTFVVGRSPSHRCITCMHDYQRRYRAEHREPQARIPNLPFAPLEAWLLDGVAARVYDEPLYRNIYRWRVSGIPLFTADRVCCEVLGVHPHQVYGDAWFSFGEESLTSEHHHDNDHTDAHAQYQEVRVHA